MCAKLSSWFRSHYLWSPSPASFGFPPFIILLWLHHSCIFDYIVWVCSNACLFSVAKDFPTRCHNHHAQVPRHCFNIFLAILCLLYFSSSSMSKPLCGSSQFGHCWIAATTFTIDALLSAREHSWTEACSLKLCSCRFFTFNLLVHWWEIRYGFDTHVSARDNVYSGRAIRFCISIKFRWLILVPTYSVGSIGTFQRVHSLDCLLNLNSSVEWEVLLVAMKPY